MRVLLVEDDEYIAQAISATLADQHYTVDLAKDGQAGWEYAEAFTYDLILLDVVLPKMDGIALCRQLRSRHSTTPILLLTSRDTSASKVEGLDAGADDYVVKPFDFLELSARIRALLRRGSEVLPPVLEWGELRLNPSTCEVSYGGQPLNLTPKEYALLELFLRNNQRVFSRRAILDHLWSFEEPPAEDTVRAHIKGLRSKLKAAGAPVDLVETVYGLGYRLKLDKRQQIAGKLESNTSEQEDLSLASRTESENSWTCFNDSVKSEDSAIATTAANSKQSALNDALAKVWERFKGSIGDRVTVLEQANTALNIGKLSEELRDQASREAHKLAGSLGTFGLAEGSRLAREMENLLQNAPRPDQAPQLSQLVTTLRRELEHENKDRGNGYASTPEPESSELMRMRKVTPHPPHLPHPPHPPLLLIVGEDESLAEALVAEAHRQGLRAQVATNLSNAREVFCQQTNGNGNSFYPDVVLLDLNLKEQKGKTNLENSYQLLAELAHQTPPVSVLVFAGQGNFTDRVEVVRLGGKAFLQKPVPPTQAIALVLDVLRRSRTAEAKVMVVDDDPQMLATLRVLLEPWGVKTVTIADPRQFWETLEMVVPDLLVLDLEMPYLTGIELCLTVRNDPDWSALPVLFLTAHTDAKTVHQIFAAGADDYVSKPLIGPELVNRIFNRLERSQLLRGGSVKKK